MEIFGPLCMNIDVIRESISLPPMKKGDHVVVQNVGAYNVTQWMQFIRMRPAVIMIGENGDAEIIRNAECVDTLKCNERIPSWMDQ